MCIEDFGQHLFCIWTMQQISLYLNLCKKIRNEECFKQQMPEKTILWKTEATVLNVINL